MIVSLTGNNSFALKQRLDELTSKFVAEHGDLALERIDGEETNLQSVIEAVQSLPFLAERKMVVLRDVGKNKQLAEAIEQIISSVNSDVDLVFYEPTTDKRTIFYKMLKSNTQFEEHAEIGEFGLPKWLVEQAKKCDASLSLADADYLVKRLGSNQTMLHNELQKLLTYDPNITRQTIDLLVEPTPQTKVFDLLDAVFAGNKQKALKLYQDQRAQKVEPQEILAMITWQLRLMALAKQADGQNTDQIAKDAGTSSYPVSKAQSLASKTSGADFKQMVAEALRIDRLAKTKPIDLDQALKTYIATL